MKKLQHIIHTQPAFLCVGLSWKPCYLDLKFPLAEIIWPFGSSLEPNIRVHRTMSKSLSPNACLGWHWKQASWPRSNSCQFSDTYLSGIEIYKVLRFTWKVQVFKKRYERLQASLNLNTMYSVFYFRFLMDRKESFLILNPSGVA